MKTRTLKLTKRWTPLRYHPEQSRLWQSKARFKVVPAGRRSGKTEIAKRHLVLSLWRDRTHRKPWADPRYFAAAPTRDQAKRIWWSDLKRMIPASWLAFPPLEGELKIVTKWGSELHVVGMDKPQRMEGSPWDGGVLDEFNDLKPETFELSVYPALADRNGWCWLQGVPKRMGPSAAEYKRRYERAARGEDPDTEAFTWRSADILPAHVIEHARANMDPKSFREQFEASWETAGGAIYDQFTKANVRPCKYNPDKVIYVGSDFNVNPMAWVLMHIYEKKRIEVFDEIYLRDTNTQRTLDHLFEKYQAHKAGFKFYGDAAARQRHTAAVQSDYLLILADPRFRKLRRAVRYRRSNPAQADRYAAVNAKLCNAAGERNLFIDPKCEHLIADLEACYIKPGTREAATGGDLTHPSDALGYPVHMLFPIRVMTNSVGGRLSVARAV